VPDADQTSRRSATILPIERKWSPLVGLLRICWQAHQASGSSGMDGRLPRM